MGSKAIKKIASIALPIAASFIPGIGPIGSILAGAAGGALGGGGLKGALLGGATSGLGSVLGSSGIIGNAAGTALDKVSGIAGAQGPTLGSGLTGAVTRGSSGLASAFKSGLGGSGGLSLGNIGTVAGGVNSYLTQNDAEEQLKKAQGRAEDALSPFYQSGLNANNLLNQRLSEGFNPGDLYSDPGYQFQLKQGQDALERSLAAKGLRQSGAALKAAQEYGQGFANQYYNDAWNRWLQENNQLAGQAGQGFNASGALGDIYSNIGNIGANADVGRSNIINGSLSSILRGSGKILYFDANGNPVYDTAA